MSRHGLSNRKDYRQRNNQNFRQNQRDRQGLPGLPCLCRQSGGKVVAEVWEGFEAYGKSNEPVLDAHGAAGGGVVGTV